MSKGLKELKRLAYENACCRCQYYIDKKCTNNYECVWKTIEKELKDKEKFEELVNTDLDLFMKMVDIKGLIEDYQKFKKALEIIKKIPSFEDYLWEVYANYNDLIKEEFNFIKEVLL